MAENVLAPETHLRRSKRLSIEYDDDVNANMKTRHVLGDITSVHNTQRNENKKGGKSSANRKLRKVSGGDEKENVAFTRSKQTKRHSRSRRSNEVAMVDLKSGEPTAGEMGIYDQLSLAMEDESEDDSSSSVEAAKPVHSMVSSPGFSPDSPSLPLGLWDNQTDAIYAYADEIYANLRQNEDKFLPSTDYMETVQKDINHTMRSILVDWLVEVGEEYKLSSQTLFLTINYIDRLLSKVEVNRSKLQLLGITCMLIAAKYEEIYPPSIDEFVYISDNTYTRDEVLTMEGVVITSLKFHLSPATPWEFCRRFSEACDLNDRVKLLADFLCEAFLPEPNSLKFPPSKIASAAVFLALYTLNHPFWTPTLVTASGYNVEDLVPCAQDLLAAHQKMCSAEGNTLKSIRDKYKEAKFLNVSTIPPKPSLPRL